MSTGSTYKCSFIEIYSHNKSKCKHENIVGSKNSAQFCPLYVALLRKTQQHDPPKKVDFFVVCGEVEKKNSQKIVTHR